MSEPMMWLLVRGVWETLAMTFVSGFWFCDWSAGRRAVVCDAPGTNH